MPAGGDPDAATASAASCAGLTRGTITPAAPASRAPPIGPAPLADTPTPPTPAPAASPAGGPADRSGAVGRHPHQADRGTGRVDGGEPGQHPGVAEQAVLGVQADVVVAEPGHPLGGGGRVEDHPVPDDGVPAADRGGELCGI